MEKKQLREQLQKADLFSRLEADDLAALLGIARMRQIDDGEILFAAGDRATGFYVLLTFAEAAAFSGLTYPVFAECMSPCQLVYFDANDFRTLIQGSPQLALNMIATMASLLQSLNQKIEDLSLREVAARLCRHLLTRARDEHGEVTDGVSIQLETTKSALAARLGTISETLSRSFKKLQQHGVVAVDRDQVTLLDCDQVQQVAEGDLKL
jgi:CRP/FNR family transcriptional regulator